MDVFLDSAIMDLDTNIKSISCTLRYAQNTI
jgi:hypothetical protein